MPRYLAIEWDDHELRALVAMTSGRSVTVEYAGAIELPSDEGKAPTPDAVGKALDGWVREQGLSRCTTLVAVGRASIELRRLTLPPAPDDELPEMVRFQAQREFSSLTDDSPLDFLPLAGDTTTPRQVLAAALSPELLAQIGSACDAAGLRAERVVLRPCATAAVVRQSSRSSDEGASLVVDPLLDELDLSVLVGEKVVFIRTLRLPHVAEDEKQYRPLLGELRRTMAAFHNQFRDVRISSITVCGDPAQRAPLAEAIEQEFKLTTSVLHPLEEVGGTSRLQQNMPEHPGRFAPLVGMVLDEAAGSHAIDFLNPRKKPEAKSHRRTYILAAAAALLLVGFYAWWQYSRISDKRLAVESLQTQVEETQQHYNEQLATTKERVDRLRSWMESDFNWLDELAEASLALRPQPLDANDFTVQDDLVAKDLLMDSGRITYDLSARQRDANARIQERIRSEEGDELRVDTVPGRDDARDGYPWSFRVTEVVAVPELGEGG